MIPYTSPCTTRCMSDHHCTDCSRNIDSSRNSPFRHPPTHPPAPSAAQATPTRLPNCRTTTFPQRTVETCPNPFVKKPEAVTLRRIHLPSPFIRHRCGRRDFLGSARDAEIDAPHAVIIDQQTGLPCEQTRPFRHPRCYREGSGLAGRDRDGQTARDRTRSVLRPAD